MTTLGCTVPNNDTKEVPPAPSKRKSKRARLKKEDRKSSNDTAATIATIYQCRFCSMKFDNSQALGGHKNCHRLGKFRCWNSTAWWKSGTKSTCKRRVCKAIIRSQLVSGTSLEFVDGPAFTIAANVSLL